MVVVVIARMAISLKKAVEAGFNSQLTDYQIVRKFIHFTMLVN
jgi:hypothetical protein